MTFEQWWEANEKQYSADACHMSEYHMASVVWAAAQLAIRPEVRQSADVLSADAWEVFRRYRGALTEIAECHECSGSQCREIAARALSPAAPRSE